MKRRELQKLVDYWQSVLRLNDWNIKAEFVDNKDMMAPNAQGACGYSLKEKRAVIHVRTERDHNQQPFEYDAEQILVHELLHCHFAGIEPDENTLQEVVLEQGIDLIAEALVRLRRGD